MLPATPNPLPRVLKVTRVPTELLPKAAPSRGPKHKVLLRFESVVEQRCGNRLAFLRAGSGPVGSIARVR